MKISYRWLKEWVSTELDAEQVAERFTLAGLEVDSVDPVAPALDGVVVGEVLAVEPHPDADRLRVCQVAGDSEQRTIVCGAPNVRVGIKVPLATLGTELPGGLKIKPAKLRGVRSEGMLCSEPELGLGEDAGGLMVLPEEAETGAPLIEALGLDDHVLEIDLTPNRADCLSVRGLARELAALLGVEANGPPISAVAPVHDERLPIALDAAEDCPCYIGRIIRNVDVGAVTPLWMVERLRRCGIRSLGPIVDVTNYVLLELGQPMHAFDLARINGGIRVRRAQKGERMTLLDGREVELDPDLLLIADHARPLALGGIMGGADSAVDDGTRDILLESAWFNPASIIGRGRRFGLATESAHRFERGVDPALQRRAAERATALIMEIAGGEPGPILESQSPRYLPTNGKVALRPARLNRVLGTRLAEEEVLAILRRLDMSVEVGKESLEVIAPSARRDIAIEEDLIEEVARVYGYDRLPTRRPGGRLRIRLPGEAEVPERSLRTQLACRGFQEIMTWSFVGEGELEQLDLLDGAQPLANPLSRDMAVLRTSLLPGLLAVAGANLRRQHEDFRLFEIGTCFSSTGRGFSETRRLGLLMTGRERLEHFSGKPRALDFFDLKGEIEHLLAHNRVAGAVRFQPCSRAWLHPGQAADVYVDGERLGWLGQLHPGLVEHLDWPAIAFVAELDAGRLAQRDVPVFSELSRFPAVRRDLSLVVAEDVAVADLLDEIRRRGGELVRRIIVFDQYRGPGVEKNCKSLSIGLIIREVSRTLKDAEVDALVQEVVSALATRFDAKLRG
ncbi:MAG: phenylalanine--tRNA ligase subunit beta [Wenzhouxiangella sp.]|nr:phenylalanine--tRNA ligase subunit beta [Wenzhouxiangella sp.]TVR98265.1 MAG: phenylalanine--tRNA ligase subunit beta [Wenzhouxiangellaceae bacterium]